MTTIDIDTVFRVDPIKLADKQMENKQRKQYQ